MDAYIVMKATESADGDYGNFLTPIKVFLDPHKAEKYANQLNWSLKELHFISVECPLADEYSEPSWGDIEDAKRA